MDRIPLLAEFIYESDLIENIRDDRELLERQLLERKSDGHVRAVLYLESLAKNKRRLLVEADIKKVQGWITAEQGEKRPDLRLKPEWIGKYRNVGVSIGGENRPPYFKVPEYMLDFISKIQQWQKCRQEFNELQNLAMLADYHYYFETIHPFADGNGRTGRALVLYCMLYMDKEPFVFTAHDKHLFYYPPFLRKDPALMRNYFFRKSGNLG